MSVYLHIHILYITALCNQSTFKMFMSSMKGYFMCNCYRREQPREESSNSLNLTENGRETKVLMLVSFSKKENEKKKNV